MNQPNDNEMEIQFATVCDDERSERGVIVSESADDRVVRINPGETRPDFELDRDSGDVTMIAVPHFPELRFEQFGEDGRINR